MIKYISDGMKTEENILTYLDSIFTQHSEFAPDLLIIMKGRHPSVILEDEFGERTITGSFDFIPIEGLNSFKMSPVDGKINLSASNTDDEEPWDFDLKISYILKTDGENLRDKIISNFPSLDIDLADEKNPIFCAVKRRKEYLDILGVYLQSNFGNDDEEDDVEAINSSLDYVGGLFHESAKRASKFKVTVHQSIVDQIQNEDPSIPTAFLDRTDGALEHPMCVKFSEKVCKELSLKNGELKLKSGVEFCLFRDDEHIFVTANSPTSRTYMARIRLDDMSNSNHRINRKQISIALSRALNLKRDREEVSMNILQRKLSEDKTSGREEVYSRVGLLLKMAFSNVFLEEPTANSGKWKTVHHRDVSLMFDEMVPILIHLCLARLDPEMRGQIRQVRAKNKRGMRRSGRSFEQKSRQLLWGNDLIRYLSDSEGGSRKRHFVNSHVRRIELKNSETIALYRKRRFPVTVENDIQIGYRMIRGHYRGTGDSPEWDGNYRFGKSPSYYSAKAIRWLKWIESENEIEIQHAEKGGELRIPLASGHIQVDGYCKSTNTVYEFHGDVYHGNLDVFTEDEKCHPFDKEVTALELFNKTIDRENLIKSIGFNLVSIWEKDWDQIERDLP